jgi:predicted permease
MSALDGIRYKLTALRRALFDRAAWRAELDEELRFHMELDAMHHGPAAARARFGRPARARERVMDATGVQALDGLRQDVRFAWRTLRASPGFTLVAVLTLALGVGATTAIFSVVSAVLLRPLPYREAERIVTLAEVGVGSGKRGMTTSYPNFSDWQRGSHSFEAMALYNGWGPAFTGAGEPERVTGALVTAGMFDVLRVVPALGRPMVPADNAPGSPGVVVLSDGFWRRRLGADPLIVGKAITLNGRPQTVIGVLPAGFHGPNVLDADVWGNNSFDASDGRSARYLSAMARLAPGVTLERARAEMRTISARLRAQYPVENEGLEAAVTPLRDHEVGDAGRALLLLLGASALVLVVACANLSNLLIARGLARSHEFALRTALGAGRGRVVRQVLVESTLVAALGALGGGLLAALALRGALGLAPAVVRAQPVGLDVRVLAFTLLVLAAAGVLAGLVPALHAARTDPQATLKTGGRGTTGGSLRARDALAVTQLALALALVTCAGLLVKSLVRMQQVDPGIRAEGVLAMSMNLPASKYPREKLWPAYDALLARLAAVPGVRAATVTSTVPYGDNFDHVGVDVYGQPLRQGADKLDAERFIVSPGYFATLGIPLRAGRVFERTDDAAHERVAVVDEEFARRLAPNGSALGMRITYGDTAWCRVVGVVGHVRHAGLDAPAVGQMYVAVPQSPWRWIGLMVRGAPGVSPASLAPAVRATIRALDPDQPVFDVTSVPELLAKQTAPRRFVLVLLGAFAGTALLLAAVGLYGVMAYAVAQRRRELGVRVSLGATPALIRRLVVGRGLRLAALGGALGVAASLAGARLLSGALFGVRPADGAVLAGTVVALVAVAVAASYVPARRAARTDPAVVLRGD